ncbi:MAG: hypothetical protein WEE89_05920 [Gemmatimonadota bacterium]
MTLSQELSEFLIELSIALHRTSMYPWGHPSLGRAAGTVVNRLANLLLDRASVSIGVAKKQLVIEGVATDAKHPVLRSLAEKLHRHHLGAIVFERGVSTEEVVAMLRLVGVEPEKEGTPLGLADPELLKQWTYLRLYPLTYEQLQLIGRPGDDDDEDDGEERERGTRSAQLWIGLARAALTADGKEPESSSTEPGAVAKAINEHPAAKAYDQVIVGYLLQLAQELKQEGGGVSSAAVRKRLSRLIGALDGPTLQRLIEMGGDLSQQKKFVLDASEALAADAVVEIVQAAAVSTKQQISNSMVRLLSKMSAFAEQGNQKVQLQADHALREQVQQLLEGWTLKDPNPDAYTRALESLARRPQTLASTSKTRYLPEPLRIVQMGLEVDSQGVPFWRAVEEVLQTDGLGPVVSALGEIGPNHKAGQALWKHIADADRVRDLLHRDTVDFLVLGKVLDRMEPALAAPVLMEVLLESESRTTRMSLLKRLASFDLRTVEPLIIENLSDERWYIRRNLLALLNEMNVYSEAVIPGPYAKHADARVRREALQLWMRSPNERERAICIALADPDERALRLGATEAKKRCPDSAVPLIAKRLQENLPVDLRTQLVKLLVGQRSAVARDALVRIASSGRSWLGKLKVAPRSPESLAALSVLAQSWASEPRVAELLKHARKSSDAEIRASASVPKSAP